MSNLLSNLGSWQMRLTFKKNSDSLKPDESQLTAIGNRSTYRGAYKESKLSPLEAISLTGLAKAGTQIHVISSSEVREEFRSMVRTCEMYLWLQSVALEWFLKFLRFDSSTSTMEAKSISALELGLKTPDILFLWIFKQMPWLAHIFLKLPFLNIAKVFGIEKRLKNSHYFLVTASATNPKSLIEAGRSAMAAWLHLESIGYKAQPMSTSSITLLDAQAGSLPEDTLDMFRVLFETSGPVIIKKQFDINDERSNIVWLFRFGKPNSETVGHVSK